MFSTSIGEMFSPPELITCFEKYFQFDATTGISQREGKRRSQNALYHET